MHKHGKGQLDSNGKYLLIFLLKAKALHYSDITLKKWKYQPP